MLSWELLYVRFRCACFIHCHNRLPYRFPLRLDRTVVVRALQHIMRIFLWSTGRYFTAFSDTVQQMQQKMHANISKLDARPEELQREWMLRVVEEEMSSVEAHASDEKDALLLSAVVQMNVSGVYCTVTASCSRVVLASLHMGTTGVPIWCD
jgi:hypothetical protein